MGIDEEIQKEYSKIKSDAIIDKITMDNSKNKFANMLLNGGIGNELDNCDKYIIQSRPLKIPFKIKVKRFIKKLKYILWN